MAPNHITLRKKSRLTTTLPLGQSSISNATRTAILAVMALSFGCHNAAADDISDADKFSSAATKLFDGKTMDGWEGNEKWFRVQDGALVAGSLKEKIPHNEFLCTKKSYRNFDLRLEAKLIGDGKNAGVQFRSKRIPNDTELIGFQADIGTMKGRSIWGALYDESRRRKFLAEDAEVANDATQTGWNKIRVLCEGPRIQIFINGKRTVDYTETDKTIPLVGIIGLQIHSGPPAEAWYRNVRIIELEK